PRCVLGRRAAPSPGAGDGHLGRRALCDTSDSAGSGQGLPLPSESLAGLGLSIHTDLFPVRDRCTAATWSGGRVLPGGPPSAALPPLVRWRTRPCACASGGPVFLFQSSV